jgi:hypothetical protein
MGIIDNLGYISKAQAIPCAKPDPWLIIKAAGNALGPTLISASTFGCIDIVRMKLGKSPWHMRGMKALFDGMYKPELEDKINKLYKFIVPAEKALFFFFVVDLTTEFFARWQSQMFKLGACGDLPDDCSWTGQSPAWVAPHANAQMLVTYETASMTGYCRGKPSNGFFVPAGYYWTAYHSVEVKPILKSKPVHSVTTWISDNATNSSPTHAATAPPPAPGNNVTVASMTGGQNKQSHGQMKYFWASADAEAVAIGGSAAVSFSATPVYNKGIIPVNCFGAPLPSVHGP